MSEESLIAEANVAAIFGAQQWTQVNPVRREAHTTYRSHDVLISRSYHRKHSTWSCTVQIRPQRPI